jgi:hypothetical protein
VVGGRRMKYKALLKNNITLENPCNLIENSSGTTSSTTIPVGHSGRYVSIWPAFLFTRKRWSFEAGIVKLAFLLQRFFFYVLIYIYVV